MEGLPEEELLLPTNDENESLTTTTIDDADKTKVTNSLITDENKKISLISREQTLIACKSLENFDENTFKIHRDNELLQTHKNMSRSSGFISEMKDCTLLEYEAPPECSSQQHNSIHEHHRDGSSPNTRIFTGSRYVHCEDSSCSDTQMAPVQLQHINGQIIMMPKQTSSTGGESLGKLFCNAQPWHMKNETSQSSESVICRICHSCGDEKLIAPCGCDGSTRYVHATCLVTWFKKSVKRQCELCKSDVKIRKINHNIALWRKPEDRPVPLIWFSVFFIGLFLNIVSIYVNASEHCKSTACLIFYVVNGFGIILDAAFLWFWFLKCRHYWKKWCALNQDWFIDDKDEEESMQVQYVQGCPV